MRSNPANAGALVLIAVGVMFFFAGASAHRRQGDVNAECAGNLGKVGTGIAEYVQDYDDTFPIVHNGADLQSAILPYVGDPNTFVCPATQLLYKPIGKWSGQTLASIGKDPHHIGVVMDAKPHPDGYSSVGYLDGHVVRGGHDYQPDSNTECIDNVTKTTTGLLIYVQDYDETLPVNMNTSAAFERDLLPFVSGYRFFRCPVTGQHYLPNGALSGASLAQINDPSTVEVQHDAKPHPNGLSTYSYLDGHVVQK
ncbi:MAG TPA: hypothetical protein VKT32_04890 [Chthonomonadaceae bacterium]|nr:hypothetical protein [Chthonomonadaceae bacterium]